MNFIKPALAVVITSALTFSLVHDVGAKSTESSQHQKNVYYKQYAVAINQVNEKYPDADLELASKKQFKKEDWVSPVQFKKVALKRVNNEFPEKNNDSTKMATFSKTKTKSFKAKTVSASIAITGEFETDTRGKRQVFTGVLSLTSKSSSKGTWKQTGYSTDLIDALTTYDISVGGEYTEGGITTSHIIPVQFHCEVGGDVI